ncbi:MAG TPA: glycosyltransferase [Gaiellaceae bacterium]|nr:glycosyltransferase [Gaiellaceae bacterium]
MVHFDETETAWCNAGVSRPASLHIHFRTLRDRPVPPPWRHEFRFVAEYVAAEVVASRRYRFLVANSIEVGKSLRRLNRQATVTVAPFSLEPSHYPPAPVDGPPCAGIIGAGYWPPTATSIDRLVRRVWPKVHRAVPAARLLIAGRDTARLSRVSPAPPGVEYLGEVDAAAAFLSQLSLLLYPATRGSGVKVKVLEAMACAVPVVTTPSGAEGVAANAGIIICDSDEELAATAVRLLQDVHERRERGAEGRAVFLRDHSPGPATVPLVELFRHMAESAA